MCQNNASWHSISADLLKFSPFLQAQAQVLEMIGLLEQLSMEPSTIFLELTEMKILHPAWKFHHLGIFHHPGTSQNPGTLEKTALNHPGHPPGNGQNHGKFHPP